MKSHSVYFLAALGCLIGCGRIDSRAIDATSTEFNAAGAPTVEFIVPDMMCEDGCAATVKEILSKQPGAKDVVVDFAAKTATVAIEEGAFDADAALAALVDKQFDHSALKTDGSTAPASASQPGAN